MYHRVANLVLFEHIQNVENMEQPRKPLFRPAGGRNSQGYTILNYPTKTK